MRLIRRLGANQSIFCVCLYYLVLAYQGPKIKFGIIIYMEENPSRNRKDSRMMSSLMDLKLHNNQKLEEVNEEERRRKQYRNGTIKGSNDHQIYQNFTLIEKKKSLIDKTLILKSLSRHFTFSSLMKDKDIQETLLEKFKLCRINKGEYLMKQNDNASSFFILHEGELDVEINGAMKRKIESGQGFGQLALLYSSPRSASIKAAKSSFLWFIDRTTFRKAVASSIQKNFTETRAFIEKNEFFVDLTSTQKDQISSIAIKQKFPKKSKICKEGELASSMYIVKSGLLKKVVAGIECGKIYPGQYCEEYAPLKKNSERRDTIVVEEDAEVIALGVEDIEEVLGKSLPVIFTRNKVRAGLLEHKEYKKLSNQYFDLALDCFKVRNVQENEVLVNPDKPCKDLIFMVLEGDYSISNVHEETKVFGCKCITKENGNMKYNFQLKFSGCGKIAFTTKEQIKLAFKCTYEESIEKTIAIEKSMEENEDRLAEIKNQCSNYELENFEVLAKLGEGQFGTVFLVSDHTHKKQYALKCISKEQTIKNKLEKHVVNEKKVLEEISSSPFCVHYIRSFKDSHYIYLLTEYINGLQLFDVIRIIGLLDVEQTRFYSAIMLHFLEVMHSKNIIYRDLKPENVMVSENGYLKFIDMGTCKQLNSKTGPKKTFTIIGTPNYMAPEIISGKGYNYTVDLWSLGVVIYEFMAGYVPFGEDAEDPYEIYQQILKKPIKFPNYMKDSNTNSFIIHLLNKVPEARLNGSYSSLNKHAFFNGIDWEKLIKKTIQPPFIIPKEKLMNVQKCKGRKGKPVGAYLESKKALPTRKDLNPKWDEGF